MKVQNMNRTQLEHIARGLGIKHPEMCNMPDLRRAVRARYHKRKANGK